MAEKLHIPAGMKFGRWTVTAEELPLGYRRRFSCHCECGTTRIVEMKTLRSGESKSCGCWGRESSAIRAATISLSHGKTGTPEYRIWRAMKSRCYNPKMACYRNYGGRGICVCSDWINSFEQFLADMGKRPSAKHTIDRIDNDGDYCPENCRWATRKEQCRNFRKNVILEVGGKSMCISEWAEETGLHPHTIAKRLRRGWPVAMAVSIPNQGNKHCYNCKGS